MLLTNQRSDKLSASRAYFTFRGMLNGPLGGDAALPPADGDATVGVPGKLHYQAGEANKDDDDDIEDPDDGVMRPDFVADVIMAKSPRE